MTSAAPKPIKHVQTKLTSKKTASTTSASSTVSTKSAVAVSSASASASTKSIVKDKKWLLAEFARVNELFKTTSAKISDPDIDAPQVMHNLYKNTMDYIKAVFKSQEMICETCKKTFCGIPHATCVSAGPYNQLRIPRLECDKCVRVCFRCGHETSVEDMQDNIYKREVCTVCALTPHLRVALDDWNSDDEDGHEEDLKQAAKPKRVRNNNKRKSPPARSSGAQAAESNAKKAKTQAPNGRIKANPIIQFDQIVQQVAPEPTAASEEDASMEPEPEAETGAPPNQAEEQEQEQQQENVAMENGEESEGATVAEEGDSGEGEETFGDPLRLDEDPEEAKIREEEEQIVVLEQTDASEE